MKDKTKDIDPRALNALKPVHLRSRTVSVRLPYDLADWFDAQAIHGRGARTRALAEALRAGIASQSTPAKTPAGKRKPLPRKSLNTT